LIASRRGDDSTPADGRNTLALIEYATRLAEQLGRSVEPAVVYVAAEMAGARHVRHHGSGELVWGRRRNHADTIFIYVARPDAVKDDGD
jgi:hypothetical protein